MYQQETTCAGNRCARLASQAHANTTHHLRALYSVSLWMLRLVPTAEGKAVPLAIDRRPPEGQKQIQQNGCVINV